jgi:hypothetical protein
MLSTVPSMARLTSVLEPLARAGAVLGGAAVIVGSGSVLPDADATAQPVPPPRPLPEIVFEEVSTLPPLPDSATERTATATARTRGDHTEVAGVTRRRPHRDRNDQGPELSTVTAPAPATKPHAKRPDPPAAGGSNRPTPAPAPADEPALSNDANRGDPRPGRPASDEGDTAAAREPGAQGAHEPPEGASPTAPPAEPPGQTDGHPDGTPPPQPDPPGRREDPPGRRSGQH